MNPRQSRGRRGGSGRFRRRTGTSRGIRSSGRPLPRRIPPRRWGRPRRLTLPPDSPPQTVRHIVGIPGHRWERPTCTSGTPRRGFAKKPWMSPVLWSEPIVVSSPLSELIGTVRGSSRCRDARHASRCRPAQSEGFGFASQGTWICPTRSRHSAGIGAPDSSRRYQSWTWSTLTSRPEIVTMRAFRFHRGSLRGRSISVVERWTRSYDKGLLGRFSVLILWRNQSSNQAPHEQRTASEATWTPHRGHAYT